MSSRSQNTGEKTDTTRPESSYRRRERREASRPAQAVETTKEDKKGKFKRETTNGLSENQSSNVIDNGLNIAGTGVNGVETKMKTGSRSAKFEEGDDFISVVSVESDEETTTKNRRDTKGKGKEIGEGVDSDQEKSRRRREEKGREGGYRGMTESSGAKDKSSRVFDREWDKGKRHSDDDDNKRRNRRKDRDMDRDRDRNRNRNHKRKYDEYENDQKYEKKWQRSDAFSKNCPWMSGVDLERCHNVAEM